MKNPVMNERNGNRQRIGEEEKNPFPSFYQFLLS